MKTPNEDSSPPAVQQPWLETVAIPMNRLVPSATNPRKRFDPAEQAELEASMRAHGFSLSTLLVRALTDTCYISQAGEGQFFLCRKRADGHEATEGQFSTEEAAAAALSATRDRFEIVAGGRRWRAAKAVGITEAPCIIRQLTDAQVMEIQLVENLQRVDLTPIEESEGLRALLELRDAEGAHLHTVASLAVKIGKSEQTVARRVKLSRLEGEARDALEGGTLLENTAMLIAMVPDATLRLAFAKEVLHPKTYEAPLTYRQAREVREQQFMRDLRGAPFSLDDAEIVPVRLDEAGQRCFGGACADCPFRLGNTPEASETPNSQHNLCLLPVCFEAKRAAGWEKWRAKETDPAKNRKALSEEECRRLYVHGDQLAYNSDLVDLADRPDSNDLKPGKEESATWRKMVKGSEITVTVARDRLGRAHELVDRELAIAAAQTNGFKNFKGETKEKRTGGTTSTSAGSEGFALSNDAPKLTEEQREKLQAAAAEDERKRIEAIDLAEAVTIALLGEIPATLEKNPNAFDALWPMLVEKVLDFAENAGTVMARRKLTTSPTRQSVAKLPRVQQMGLFAELWAAELLELEGERTQVFEDVLKELKIDVKGVAKRVASERQKARVKIDLPEGVKWLRGPKEDGFTFNEHDCCTDADEMELSFPKAMKIGVRIEMAKSEKGWHSAHEFQCSTGEVRASSAPVKRTEKAHKNRALAVVEILHEADSFLRSVKASQKALDDLFHYRRTICGALGGVGPEEEKPAAKKPNPEKKKAAGVAPRRGTISPAAKGAAK